MIVVKVGGSLFDHPQLGPCCRAYLDSLAPAEVLLVAGGGAVVEAVRTLDRMHGLGEETAHWLALRAMAMNAKVLHLLIEEPNSQTPFRVKEERVDLSPASFSGKGVGGLSSSRVLDCFAFANEDDSRPGALPHSWDVTSDSLAARAAVVFGADQLVLLKSVDVPPDTTWEGAASRGWVDPHFPLVVANAPFSIDVLNFQRVLELAQTNPCALRAAEFFHSRIGRLG